eukprot:jgi/Orpsp1_1/1182321/evm.model.c7180000080817.2
MLQVRFVDSPIMSLTILHGKIQPFLVVQTQNGIHVRPDEKRFLEAIHKDFIFTGIKSVYFDSDRKHPGEWCNQTSISVGARPQPLGESNGTSDESVSRFNDYCGCETAMKLAPEIGQWFQKYFEQGLENANPPL